MNYLDKLSINNNVSGYVCNHSSLRIGNETLRPLEGAMGTPSVWPVSEAWLQTPNALDIGRWTPMTQANERLRA